MQSRSVRVSNRLGLHARAAARFVHLASRFQSHVKVSRDSQTMDGKSIMGILLLAAAAGTVLTISASGDDEQAAVDALCAFIETGLGEDTCSA
jgi:phosphocarrier protein HPr